MKKFPFNFFLLGEVMVVTFALREFPKYFDILGMFCFLQIPILSLVVIVWLDRLTGDNK